MISDKNITREIIHCWYELSWQGGKEPAFLLRIHQEFIEQLNKEIERVKEPISKWFIIRARGAEFNLGNFQDDFQKEIGFGGLFKRRGEKNGFAEFSIAVPKIEKKTGKEKCFVCKGSGKYDFVCKGSGKYENAGGKCSMCEGTGKEKIHIWSSVLATSLNFSVLFWILECEIEGIFSTNLPQLFEIKVGMLKDGCTLTGKISAPLAKWLAGFKEDEFLPEVAQAMKETYKHIGPARQLNARDFKANISRMGGFILGCPGFDCALTSIGYYNDGRGYEFGCHDLNNVVQLIALLSGLAALHDKARREMKI